MTFEYTGIPFLERDKISIAYADAVPVSWLLAAALSFNTVLAYYKKHPEAFGEVRKPWDILQGLDCLSSYIYVGNGQGSAFPLPFPEIERLNDKRRLC